MRRPAARKGVVEGSGYRAATPARGRKPVWDCALRQGQGTEQDILLPRSRFRHATVPLLQLCYENLVVYQTRVYVPEQHPELKRALHEARITPLFFLFPGDNSRELSACVRDFEGRTSIGYVLVAVDGTWKHAKEMCTALLPILASAGGIRVCLGAPVLPPEVAHGPNPLALRMEPAFGFFSTCEAVARSIPLKKCFCFEDFFL
jgi:hypothetical protein